MLATALISLAMTAITDADRVGFTGLNDQQWRTLVHMLNDRNSGDHDHLSGMYFSGS